jgi:hypothetical protein
LPIPLNELVHSKNVLSYYVEKACQFAALSDKIISFMGMLDVLNGFATFSCRSDGQSCLPKFLQQEEPVFNARRMWHPFINPQV